ncbi:hypothetical protein ACUNV4_10465 [Granulosicoccus sp. 3-233]|uniref:hypothetical protein n=1 Tax=Granulosicoccus sp. 3-233 TaxID=3417969 RepID=UPI003D33361A
MKDPSLQNDGKESDTGAARAGPIDRLIAWMHLKDEHPLLPLSLARYVPISVVLNFLGVALLVILGFDTLLAAFLTNVPLNGLIIAIMLIGVGMSVTANLKLWMTGLYLNRLGNIAMQFRIRDEEIASLQKELTRKASILDCKNMQNLLDNLRNMGALNVNDNDARMIKSKLGARINRGRGKVSFLGGLLVMLGLLGTFLGLLGTIDAVGEAMAGMASIGSDSGDGGGMSGFISSLAAPLQGMGLAFSSSLFGLSGSLLVGTFQFFSNGAQDHFIEAVSRWLDEQIPGMAQANKSAGRPSDGPPVADAELKAWIVGFIQSSRNTQRELADVVDAILISADASHRAIENNEHLVHQHKVLSESLASLNQGIQTMVEQQARVESVLSADFARSLLDGQSVIGDRLGTLDKQFDVIMTSQQQAAASMNDLSRTLSEQIPRHVLQTTDRLGKALDRVNGKLARLSTQDQAQVSELASQIRRLEKMVIISERRSVQRDQKVQNNLQHQFRRESDRLKKTIGDNIASSVNKDVIPFIAREQRELQKLARIIDRQYGRRKDDREDPDAGVA